MRTYDKPSLLILSLLLTLLGACSTTQQDQQQQQQQQQLDDDLDGQENFGSNENFANEGLNNFENEFDNNFENGAGNEFADDDGAGFNTAEDNEFGFNNAGGGENDQLFSNQNFQGENQFGNSEQAIFAEDGGNGFEQTNNNQMFGLDNNQQAMFGQGEDVNNALQQEEDFALQNTGNQGLNFENDQMMDNDQMANNNTNNMTVQEGGLVKYVSRDGTSLKDQPEGSTIRSLDQGDHPLVFEEGEWSRTSDGYYISSIELTPDPVPRRKIKANWTY